MKKIIRKLIIAIIILSLSLSPIAYNINYFNSIKKAEASAPTATFTLEMMLHYLIGLTTKKKEVSLPLPPTRNETKNFLKKTFAESKVFAKGILNATEWTDIVTGMTYSQYVGSGGEWSDINLSNWVSNTDIAKIRNQQLDEIAEDIAEYYEVPELKYEHNTGIDSRVANIGAALRKNNINIGDGTLESTGIGDYQYHITSLQSFGNVYNTPIRIFATNRPFLFNAQELSTGYYRIVLFFDKYIPLQEEFLLVTITFNNSAGRWSISTKKLDDYEYHALAINISENEIEENYWNENNKNLILYTNYLLKHEIAEWNSSFKGTQLANWSRDSDHSYKTFLKSKYMGNIDLSGTKEITINPHVINWEDEEAFDIPIDTLSNTDKILEHLKNIDDWAREHGEEVVSEKIYTREEWIGEKVIADYEHAIGIEGVYIDDMKDTYGTILPNEEVNIPGNILLGLTFIAYVFGITWDNMGEYVFIYAFPLTIGAIAILIGLGLQKNKKNNDNKSDKKG